MTPVVRGNDMTAIRLLIKSGTRGAETVPKQMFPAVEFTILSRDVPNRG